MQIPSTLKSSPTRKALLPNLPILVPVNGPEDGPVPGSVAEGLAPDVQRNPQKEHKGGDSAHGAVGVDVSGLLNPGVGVEGEKETKHGYSFRVWLAMQRIRNAERMLKKAIKKAHSHLKPMTDRVISPATGL